ncbi:MAG: ABC transporter ATP-binding protein [Desulfuromonas sp.]|nr:ABC transporter ATP-binding protein [Desulfuromonas sp.]
MEIRDGELLVLLGPSGSGKTTLMRLCAGLERLTSGTIRIDGEVVNDLPPRQREIAMVFQNYALYPHKTVFGNIAFPLRVQGDKEQDIRKKVEWAAGLFEIGHLLERMPSQLSGGERQRVAIARAVVRRPKVFLMDEPLSNLDAKVRDYARGELKKFQQQIGVTTIFVTHDQVEAMGLGDRIAVLHHGRLRQIGTPAEIYHNPADIFVAGFIGIPPMNFIERDTETLGFRPEVFLPAAAIDGDEREDFRFRVEMNEDLSSYRILYGTIDGAKVRARLTENGDYTAGEVYSFSVRRSDLYYFDRETGVRRRAGSETGETGTAHARPEVPEQRKALP